MAPTYPDWVAALCKSHLDRLDNAFSREESRANGVEWAVVRVRPRSNLGAKSTTTQRPWKRSITIADSRYGIGKNRRVAAIVRFAPLNQPNRITAQASSGFLVATRGTAEAWKLVPAGEKHYVCTLPGKMALSVGATPDSRVCAS